MINRALELRNRDYIIDKIERVAPGFMKANGLDQSHIDQAIANIKRMVDANGDVTPYGFKVGWGMGKSMGMTTIDNFQWASTDIPVSFWEALHEATKKIDAIELNNMYYGIVREEGLHVRDSVIGIDVFHKFIKAHKIFKRRKKSIKVDLYPSADEHRVAQLEHLIDSIKKHVPKDKGRGDAIREIRKMIKSVTYSDTCNFMAHPIPHSHLQNSFIWDNTSQMYSFWSAVYREIERANDPKFIFTNTYIRGYEVSAMDIEKGVKLGCQWFRWDIAYKVVKEWNKKYRKRPTTGGKSVELAVAFGPDIKLLEN